MRAMVFTPKGKGPFALALINHGSEQDANARATAPMPSFPALTDWFVSRGYVVVVPERLGHGKTGGRYLEDQGICENADYVAAGNGAADSIAAAMDYMQAQTFVRKGSVVIAGNSAGAWGALALAARRPAGIRAVVDFAGGRGGHDRNRPNHNCSPDRLVAAAGVFGKGNAVPAVWLYAANDTYFPPDLSGKMAAAYREAGGNVEYHLLPAVGGEGHGLIQAPAAWAPSLEAFLGAH
jgi:dienelactone hydrolase